MLVRQTDQKFVVAGFGDEASFPPRIGKIIEDLGLLVFFDLVGIPRADKENEIVGGPEWPFQICRISLRFRWLLVEYQSLSINFIDIFQAEFNHVGNRPSAARFGNGAGGKLVRGGIDVIDADAWKTLLKNRIDFFRIDLRKRTVAI